MDERIRLSRKQERRGAGRYGGYVTSGSGNQHNRKGDVHTETELIEFKTTRYRSFRLSLDDLKTASKHALLAGKRMVFGVEFNNSVVGNDRYVVLEEDDYLAMRNELETWREAGRNSVKTRDA